MAIFSLFPIVFAVAPLRPIDSGLTALDIVIIALPLTLAFAVSLYMRRLTHSVVDYLAAGRTAGRYLIAVAGVELGAGAAAGGYAMALEVFSQTGYSLQFWQNFTGFFFFLLALSGLVTYRFRETRALTFHQFFEVRYSKGVRVFASVTNSISSLLVMAIGPIVSARFFVYFLGLAPVTNLGFASIPTSALIMVIVTAVSLYFAFAGGQLTVMTTDCLEGLIGTYFALAIAFTVLYLISYHQMGEALSSGKPGASYIDPFDIGVRSDFGYGFLLLSWFGGIYCWRGNAWQASFTASAKSAHEAQMAVILGIWRGMAGAASGALTMLAAFTIMHSPDFAGYANEVGAYLQRTIPNEDAQLREQLLLPTALGCFLPAGLKGMIASGLLMALVAGMSAQIFQFSTGVIQDIVLPFAKKRLEPAWHIRLLRLTALCLAIYSVFFGLVFKFTDYLAFVTQLMSAVYIAGIGCVVWGGLYWSRGTREGAWSSMMMGLVLAGSSVILQQFWPSLVVVILRILGPGSIADFLREHSTKFPFNGQILSTSIMGICLVSYIAVSFITCREPYDMDKLLHRGKYRVSGEKKPILSEGFRFSALAGINESFTLGDRRLAYTTLVWGIGPNFISLGVLVWNLFVHRWTWQEWWGWFFFWQVGLNVVGGIVVAIWFTWGVTKDMRQLIKDLKAERVDITDDGQYPAAEPGSNTDHS